MGFEAIVTLAVLAGILVAMVRRVAGPDLVLLAGLTVLLVAGVVTPLEAFRGFSNPGVLAVAALFVVAAGVRDTGGLEGAARRLLGHPKSLLGAHLRLMLPVAAFSAFLANTAVVAMAIPIVQDWAKRLGRSPSRLLIPLSYAAILGGTVSLLGTSTNLVVLGLVQTHAPETRLGLFDVAVLGLPALAVGVVYVAVASRWLLPDRSAQVTPPENPRAYTVVMRVESASPLVGQTVEGAGLRHLPGLFLAEIERQGITLPAVDPETALRGGDQLVFVGIVESVADLQRFPGLVPAEEEVERQRRHRPERGLVEAVVAGTSPLVGRSVREARFRTQYGAAILSVRRHGQRVHAKVGDIVLEPGDTLLMEAPPGFARLYRNHGEFLLVSEVENARAPRRHRARAALLILTAMVVLAATGVLPLVTAALLAAGAMVASGSLGGSDARQALDLRILIAIAAALGIGSAVETSGIADAVASGLITHAGPLGPVALLLAVYLVAALFTEVISNAAAAALVFPIAAAAAEGAGLPLTPFALVLMVAASASFSTPIGYQTNLMVYGPGAYRFGDFVRFGLPLQLMVAAVVVSVAAVVWF